MVTMYRAMRCALLAFAACAAPAHAAMPLTLAQAVRLALSRNHDARLAAIAVDSAEAAQTQARAAPNPSLTLQTTNINPAAGVGAGSLRSKTVDSTVRVDQLVERGGKRELRGAAAAQLVAAARADADDVRRQLRRDVGQAYYDLLAAQERVQVLVQLADLSEHALRAAQQRERAGDLAPSDTLRLRMDALRARNDADSATASLGQAQRALALLLGAESGELPSAVDGWPALVLADRGQALIERRADVRAAQARLDAARAAHKLALAGRTRDITVGVQFEHYPASAANPQGSGNSVGIAVQVPLFVRYGMEGEVRAAQASVDAAEEALLRTRQLARAELDKASAELKTSAALVGRFEHDILPAARKASEAGEFAFSHGASSVMDVLDVRRSYRAAELDAIAARADFAKSAAAFDAAISEESKE
ncbi:TolC family protein [Massilia solisilvae]|uniref:TolC family protein n=1 Tax=Massilia solisilvae TaxID=1811225 RepID=A0ABT2BJX7_9BURK|nr:TolC family protein [Massilia solisilvae]MCS0608811.1 TolC family protein [Massilia solisilvae]